MIVCVVIEYNFIYSYRTLFVRNTIVCYSVNIDKHMLWISSVIYLLHCVTESDQVRTESDRVLASTSVSSGAASMLFTACETFYVIVIANNMDCKSYIDFLLLSAL